MAIFVILCAILYKKCVGCSGGTAKPVSCSEMEQLHGPQRLESSVSYGSAETSPLQKDVATEHCRDFAPHSDAIIAFPEAAHK
jgi:hypothetical protein